MEEWSASELNLDFFSFADYAISVGKKELTGVVKGEFTANGEFFTGTSYKYDENHLLRERIITDSKGESLRQEYRHPINYTEKLSMIQ